jgi:predicted transcriptional regulator
MSIKPELHRLVDELDEEDEQMALDYLRWLLADENSLTEDERRDAEEGEAEIERGEYITLDDMIRSLCSRRTRSG